MNTNWRILDDKLIDEYSLTNDKVSKRLKKLRETKISSQQNKVADFKVHQHQLQKKAKSKISVSPFFKGDGNYENFKYRYFAGGFSDKYRITVGENSRIEAERFGLGISLELKISNLKTALSGGFGAIAAAVEMQLANAQYSYTIHALPEGDFYDLLPPIGKFDYQSFQKFHNLVKKLKELYKEALKNKLDLVAIEVLLSKSINEEGTKYSRSYYYAAKQIIEELSLEKAIKKSRKGNDAFNEDAIQYIYKLCGLDSIEQIPISSNISRARDIIFV